MTTLPIVTPSNLGADFDMGSQVANKINIVAASTTTSGKVRLAAAADLTAGTAGAAVDAAALKSAIAGVATPASVAAQASVAITDAFGNAVGHALP